MSSFGDHPVTDDLRWKRVRKGLGNLCQHGVEHWWIRQKTPALLDLEIVMRRAAEITADTYRTERALIEVLRDHVRPFHHEPAGVILRVVLGLDDPYKSVNGIEHSLLDKNVTDRRILAGSDFRGGRNGVGHDAIRLNHEPAALDQLGVGLLRAEVVLNGAQTPDGLISPDEAANMLMYLPGETAPDSGQYVICDRTGARLDREVSLAMGDTLPSAHDATTEFGWRSSVRVADT